MLELKYKKLFKKLNRSHRQMIREFKTYCAEIEQERLDIKNALLKERQKFTNVEKDLYEAKLQLKANEEIIDTQKVKINYHEDDVRNAVRDAKYESE